MTALVEARAARRAPRVVPERPLDSWRPALAGADRTAGTITLPSCGGAYGYDPATRELIVDGARVPARAK